MSLINDALKRANAEKSRDAHSPTAPPAVPPLEPVETAPTSPLLPWAILVLGLGVLAVAATLWLRGRPPQQLSQSKSTQTAASPATASRTSDTTPGGGNLISSEPKSAESQPQVVATTPTTSEPQPTVSTPAIASTATPAQAIPPAPEPAPAVTTPPVAEPKTPSAETQTAAINTTVSAVAEGKPTVSEPPPSDQSRPPRLQAIYYRLRGPTVVINGKTLRTGQSVDGIQVVSIQRTSVEVTQDGKYRTLTLQD